MNKFTIGDAVYIDRFGSAMFYMITDLREDASYEMTLIFPITPFTIKEVAFADELGTVAPHGTSHFYQLVNHVIGERERMDIDNVSHEIEDIIYSSFDRDSLGILLTGGDPLRELLERKYSQDTLAGKSGFDTDTQARYTISDRDILKAFSAMGRGIEELGRRAPKRDQGDIEAINVHIDSAIEDLENIRYYSLLQAQQEEIE